MNIITSTDIFITVAFFGAIVSSFSSGIFMGKGIEREQQESRERKEKINRIGSNALTMHEMFDTLVFVL